VNYFSTALIFMLKSHAFRLPDEKAPPTFLLGATMNAAYFSSGTLHEKNTAEISADGTMKAAYFSPDVFQ
jgi:hypothetical protein